MQRPTELDLKKLAGELGSHFNPGSAHEITGQCKICGEWVSQTEDHCVLGHPAYWKGSKVWNELFLSPKDRSSVLLLRRANTSSFKDGAEYHKWMMLKDLFSEEQIQRQIDYCAGILKCRGVYGGRALVKYVLNSLQAKEKEPDDDRPNVFRVNV